MYSSKSSERPPRTMLIAGQNETVRKTAAQSGFPATVGLQGCVAVIIADKKGNVSLTHADADTDLSFISREVEFMDGEFTIDLVKQRDWGELDLKILGLLDEERLSNTKFSGRSRVLETDEGTVMYNYIKGVPQFFLFNEFKEIATPGVNPSQTNALHTLGYNVQTCEADPMKFQLRVYTRQLNQALSSQPTAFPILVHDASGWLETEVNLEEEVSLLLKKGQPSHNTFFSPGKMASFSHVYPRYQALVEALDGPQKTKEF
ncbi:hypothetical protein [Legionella feeleii]|uniref:Uncharacterized protein n=1 Tax=Legionella feeleii TaxID=453 RepID=A0A378IPU0_9GAMM|nr:hypothetical protein [Legionella feeleii]STX37139.1 Uncharacterised protein [Legionella feeleii]